MLRKTCAGGKRKIKRESQKIYNRKKKITYRGGKSDRLHWKQDKPPNTDVRKIKEVGGVNRVEERGQIGAS